MKVLFTYTPRVLVLASLFLSGCAAKNPEWLRSPSGAYCASGLSGSCLKALAANIYTDATAKQVAAQAASAAKLSGTATKVAQVASASPGAGSEAVKGGEGAVSNGTGGEGAESVSDKPAVEKVVDASAVEPAKDADGSNFTTAAAKFDGSIPKLVFGIAAIGATAASTDGYTPTDKAIQSKEAGAILNVGSGPVSHAQVAQAGKISDKELRADALSGLISLHARSMSEDQINTVLNELYSLDKAKYANALIVKLPGLLKSGDLERASALRGVLLASKSEMDRPFSMLAFVASCYTMAGMKQDAGAIVQDFLEDGGELSIDDQKLITLAISVSNGSYPMMQEFYDFKSDEARLSAYLTIAVIARQLDNLKVAHRAVADAVKFIQKAAVKVDREKALSQILAVSPGII